MDSNPNKLLKKSIQDRQKRIKPRECQKYIRMVIDSRILSATYGQDFIADLNSGTDKIKYDIKTLPIKESIVWERNMGQLSLIPNEVNTLSEIWQKENQVVKILTHSQLLEMIKTDTLQSIINDFNKYCANQGVNNNMQCIVLFLRNNAKLSTAVSSALIELQVMYRLKVLQVEPYAKELYNNIKHLTKAIAEVPYKKQKSEILGSFKKFLANDKKQCVRVEGSNGFGRLWQQHLNRLPLVTLEVAETIIDKYSCPKNLLEDLKYNELAVKEISDLKIKRSGPIALLTDRRIGNALSHKLYTLYTSKNANELI